MPPCKPAPAELREEGAEADSAVAFAFAVLHDAGRSRVVGAFNGRHDGEHASRGADRAREMLEDGDLLSGAQLDLLIEAIEDHDAGLVSDNPTIGTCWDADRLNLWRLGIEPNVGFLSTEAAKRPEVIEWARELQEMPAPSWAEVFPREANQTPSQTGEAAF